MPTGIYKHKPNQGFQKGVPFSKEHKRKIGKAKKGKPLSKEHKKNISSSHLGLICSDETKEKISHAHKGKGHKQTKETRLKIGNSITGKKHWNWKNGATAKEKKIRNSLEYRLWRKAVFERDDFTCQKCKQKGGVLRAHHINNFADFPELRLAIDNGIALCKECHIAFHKRYGKRNNTKEQLIEFLNLITKK